MSRDIVDVWVPSRVPKNKPWQTNIAGEMTVMNFKDDGWKSLTGRAENESDNINLIDAVAKTLRVTSTEEIEGLTDVLMPSILCAAVYTGDIR